MPDPRKKLYDALTSNNFELGTFDEFNSKMDNPESRKKLYKSVSTNNFDLGSFDDFESKIGDKKKSPVSGSTSAGQKSAVAPKTGSLDGPTSTKKLSKGFPLIDTNSVAPGYGQQPASKGKNTPKAKKSEQKYEEGTMAWNHRKMIENNPDYVAKYEQFKEVQKVSDLKKEEIAKGVEDEFDGVGVWNNIKNFGKETINAITEPTIAGISSIGALFSDEKPSDYVQKAVQKSKIETDPFASEKAKAKKEFQEKISLAKKNKETVPVFTIQDINQRAKEIKIQERIDSQSETQLKDYLKKDEETGSKDKTKFLTYEAGKYSTIKEKDKLLLEKQNIERNVINGLKGELSDLKKEIQTNGLNEENKNRYLEKSNKYREVIQESINTHNAYTSNRKDLGSSSENLDIFKRDYSSLKSFIGNIDATITDLSSGALGAIDYGLEAKKKITGQQSPFELTTQMTLRGAAKDLKSDAEKIRAEIMKPIAVDNINTLSDAGDWFFQTALAQQVPIYTLIATGNFGIASIGGTSLGNKFEEMQSQIDTGEKKYTTSELMLNPIGYGITETASAMVDRMLLKNMGRVISSATRPERQLVVSGFAKRVLDATLKVSGSAAKGALYEGVDEGLTKGFQNLIDGKPFTEDMKDPIAAGAVMGLVMPLGAQIIAQTTKLFSTDSEIQQSALEVMRLRRELDNTELSDLARQTIQEDLTKSQQNLETLAKKTIGNVESLSKEQFQEIIQGEKTMANIKEKAIGINDDTTIDSDLKKQLLKNLQEAFTATNQRRIDLLERGASVQMERLDPTESIRLKNLAAKRLMQEQNPDGTRNITLNDEEISRTAIQIYNAEVKERSLRNARDKELLEREQSNNNGENNTPEIAPSPFVASTTNVTLPPPPENYDIVTENKTQTNAPSPSVEQAEEVSTVVDEKIKEGKYEYNGKTYIYDGSSLTDESGALLPLSSEKDSLLSKVLNEGVFVEETKTDNKEFNFSEEEKTNVQKKVVEEPRVLLRRGAVGEDAFFALPNEGIYGEVVDKIGADENYTAYQYPEDFKIKDLSNDVVFDDYMSSKMYEQTKEDGYDAAYVIEIDGSKVLHVVNPSKLTLLDGKLPELRNNETAPPTNTPTDGNVRPGTESNVAQGENKNLQPAPKPKTNKGEVRQKLQEINKTIFGLKTKQAKANALVMEKTIETMAKRAGISTEEMFDQINFEKADATTMQELTKKGKALFQVIGENAKLSKEVKQFLNDAKALEKQGVNPKAIFMQTGWEKGADGKWKYDLQEGKVAFKKTESGKLEDVLDYDELFQKYPDARNIQVVFNSNMDAEGMFDPAKNRIFINPSSGIDESRLTLLHEIQHWIQNKEGFSKGSNTEMVRNVLQSKINETKNKSERTLLNRFKNLINSKQANPSAIKETLSKLQEIAQKEDFELYESIAGEVEARNVEKRFGMSAEQRTNTPLSETEDVSRDEQIVLFQGEQGAMLAEDGKFIVYALTDPNVSTPLHELAHVYEHYLTESEKATVLKEAGQESWTRETSEFFARGFEKYLADGIAPNPAMKKLFESFKEWLTEIYNGIANSEIDLVVSPKMKTVFDEMLGEKANFDKNKKSDGRKPTKKDREANPRAKEEGNGENNEVGPKPKEGGKPDRKSPKTKRISLKGRTPLAKRNFKGDRAKANNIEPVDARSLVLQYFIGGGRVTKEAILKLYRGSENEFTARTKIGGYAFTNSGKSVDEITHDIWERRGNVEVDTSDIKEAVEAVIGEHSRISSMVQEMLPYGNIQPVDDINQLEEEQQMFEEVQEEFAASPEEKQEAISLFDHLTENEIIKLAEEEQLSFQQLIEDLDSRQVTYDFGPFVGERGTLLDNGDIISETGELLLSKQVSNVNKIQENDNKGVGEVSNEQNRSSKLAKERVQYEKITPKNPPKKLSSIIKDVATGLKSHLIYSRSKRRNTLGSYNPRNTLVRITNAGDIDTVAHELGHLLDDRLNVLGTIPTTDKAKIDAQLKWYSDRGGSNPPASYNAAQKAEYLQREGLAEFIRSYIANPSQTTILAPELLAHFEKTIDAKTQSVLTKFSEDYLDFANASSIEKTLSNIEEIDLPNKNKFIEWVKSFRNSGDKLSFTKMDKFYGEMANSNHFAIKAFKVLVDMQGKVNIKSHENFEIMSRVFLGINGKLENVFSTGMINSKNEKLRAEGGVFEKNNKGRTVYKDGTAMNVAWLIDGLDTTTEEILKKDMGDVIAMAVAERTIEYAKKFERTDNLTGIGGSIETDLTTAVNALNEFKALEKTDKAKFDRIKEGVKRYRQMADATLQYAADKGRISQEQLQQIKAGNEYYVALNRNTELEPGEDLFSSFNTGTNGIGAAKDIIKKAKGGTATIENPYLSLLKNMNNIIKEADRNEVMLSFVEPLISTRTMGQGTPVDLSKIGFIANEGDAETIKVFREGKLEKWKFDSDIYSSLKNIESIASNPIFTFLSKPSQLIRWTVTHNPVFYARNIVKDTQARMIVSNDHSSFKDMIHNSGDKELFELFGGSQAGHLHTSKESYATTMKNTIKEITKKGGIVINPLQWGNKYVKFLQTGENLNRIAEFNNSYKVAKEKGMSDYDAGLYAAFQARDLMDFAVAGHTMREINKVVVFSNAGVQSLRKASKSLKKDPIGFAARTALYSVIPTLAFAILRNAMGDDEEYEDLPDNQRDMFFNFKTPATGDAWISIPKPYELGLFSAYVDRGISKIRGNNEAFDGVTGTTMKLLLPFDESSFLGGLKPLIETKMNRDTYTNKSIVPEWEAGKLLELRKGTDKASLIGQKMSKLFSKAGMSVDPRNVDHILKGYGTYFANQGMAITDLAKEDRAQLNFWITKTGFAKDIPTYNSKSVKKATDLSVELGQINSKMMKGMRNDIEAFYSETDIQKRKELLKDIYKKSKEIRNDLEQEKIKVLKEAKQKTPN